MDRFFGNYIPIFLVTIFVGVFYLMRWMSGWLRLAKGYEFSRPFQGKIWRWRGGRMNGVTGPFNIGVNVDGLYIAQPFIFRIGHPQIFIPWHDINVVEDNDSYKRIEIHFKNVPDITFEVSRRFGHIIAEAAGPSWPLKKA